MGPHAFARLLIIILPTTLIVTYVLKMASGDHLRRDAIAELYATTEETARQAPTVVHHYVTGGGSVGGSSSECSAAERRALFRAGARLSDSGGHGDFMLRAGWGEAADCCEWKGVGCVPGRGVVSLSLSKEGLRGTLPTQLAALPHLTTLDVNENAQLSGTLPTALLASSSLEQVYAFGARISGTVPSQIGSARALQELEMSNCRLSGTLPSAGLPTSLRFVFLESNKLSGSVPAALSRCRRLKELELSHNRFSGSLPAAVAHLRLDHLDFGQNPRLSGVPKQRTQQGCSGGGDRYLRGQPQQQQPGAAGAGAGAAAGADAQQQAAPQAQQQQPSVRQAQVTTGTN